LAAGVLAGSILMQILTYSSHFSLGMMTTVVFLLGFFMAGATVIVASIECDIGKDQFKKDGV